MSDFLQRISVDWNPAITSTRQFISQISAELEKLSASSLSPARQALSLTSGGNAVAQATQAAVVAGSITPAEAAAVDTQGLALIAQRRDELGTAMTSQAEAARIQAQATREQVAVALSTNDEFIASRAETVAANLRIADAAKREVLASDEYVASKTETVLASRQTAQQLRESTTRQLASDDEYIASRAETIAAQRRIQAEALAQAKAINGEGGGPGGGGGSGGGLLGFGGGSLLGFAAVGAGFQLAGQVRSAVDEALKLNQQLNVLREQADAIGQNSGFPALRDQIIQIAEQTGVAASQVATLASEFLGLYQNTAQAGIAASDAAKLLLVIGDSAGTAGPQIAALAEDLNVSVQDVGNTVIDLVDKTGRSGADMLAALGQVAPVAAELNLTLAQTAGLIESVGIGSAKSGQQLGEGLARVLPQLQQNLAKIDALGVPISAAAAGGDTLQALKDLLNGYGNLTQAQKQLVTAQLGGPRNAQILAAALQDPARALAALDSQLSDHNLLNSRSAAAEETFAGSVTKLHQALVGLGDGIAKSGVIDFISQLVSEFGHFLTLIDGLPARVAVAVAALAALSRAGALFGIGGAAGAGAGAAAAETSTIAPLVPATTAVGAAGAARLFGFVNPVTGVIVAGSVAANENTKAKSQADKLRAQLEQLSPDQLQARSTDNSYLDNSLLAQIGRHGEATFLPKSETVKVSDVVKQAQAEIYANSIQSNLTELLKANVFSPEDAKKISADLNKSTDPKAIAQLKSIYAKGADSPAGKAALAIQGAAKAQADGINAAVNSNAQDVTSLDDAKALWQQGDISFGQYAAGLRQEIDRLKIFTDATNSKQRNKDIADLTAGYSSTVKTAVQNQIDAATAAGTLSDQLALSLYTNALKNPQSIVPFDRSTQIGPPSPDELAALKLDPATQLALTNQQATQAQKQHADRIAATNALAKANANGDPLLVAIADQTAAVKNLTDTGALKGTTGPEYQTALAAKLVADQAVTDQQNNVAKARIDLLKAQDANDPLKTAKDDQAAAQLAINDAKGTAAQLSAEAAKISADRAAAQAVDDIYQAQLELIKATQTAAGDTVGAAQTGVKELQAQLASLLKAGADPNGKAILALQAQIKTAQAAVGTTQISEGETQIDNDLTLKRITVGQAVARLRQLQQLAVGQDAIDAINIKIQQLLTSTSQTTGLNVPANIHVPTLYEVRRVIAQGSPAGYQDNRAISFAPGSIVINNGMDAATAQAMLANAIGVPTRTMATTSRIGV